MSGRIKFSFKIITVVVFISFSLYGQGKDVGRELKRLNAKIDRVRVLVDSLELDNQKKLTNDDKENISGNIVQEIEVGEKNENVIVNTSLDVNAIKLAGLYDPAENGLSIDMWSYSLSLIHIS
mgnify:CR=1 FL=1